MTQFNGKRALITGGARGLGKLLAKGMVDRGAQVVLLDINETLLEETAAELGTNVSGYICDITDREAVYRVADQVRSEVGHIDILVNNAGIVSGKKFLDLSDEMIEKTMQVNTLSLFWTARAFLPQMVEKGDGHVVTIASAAGLVGVEKLVDYCASKFGAVGFDESLRVSMKKDKTGVKTTVVCPYFIDTGMFDGVKTRFPLLLPVLKEQYVADKVLRAIEKDRARLILPRFVSLVPLAKWFPPLVFDFVMSVLGINSSMDEFHGHGEAPAQNANASAASSKRADDASALH